MLKHVVKGRSFNDYSKGRGFNEKELCISIRVKIIIRIISLCHRYLWHKERMQGIACNIL